MDSLGQDLRLTREDRKLSLEQVARDTNISRHYIVALEEDNYDVFPAEPYLIGFLRTYSEYLELNSQEIVTRYRTVKIQEQPAPLTELIHFPNPWPRWALIGGITVGVFVVLGVFVIPPFVGWIQSLAQDIDKNQSRETKEYVLPLEQQELTERLLHGDVLVVHFSKELLRFQVQLGSELELFSDNVRHRMKLGEEVFLDLDNDSQDDIRFFLKDFSPELAWGAELTVERLASVAANSEEAKLPEKSETPVVKSTQAQEARVILEDAQPRPFLIEIVTQGYVLVRYLVDDNEALRQEKYFHKGEVIRIEANKWVKIGISNASSVVAKINGIEVKLGNAGEVVASYIEWVKTPSGKLQLVARPL